MNLNFVPLISVWSVFALAVLALIVWRKSVARNEDDQLHVLQASAVAQQAEVAQKLELIDKWGKIVTGVTIAFGLLIAGLFVYQTWVTGSTTVPPGA